MVQWGVPIEVNGKRPDWLRDDETTVDLKTGWGWTCSRRGAETTPDQWAWPSIDYIRFPVDHAYYLAASKGFTYWPGGDAAPEDWDGAQVLLSDGRPCDGNFVRWWSHHNRFDDIIGYGKRATEQCCNRTVQVGHRCTGCPHDDAITTHIAAAPASYRGEIGITPESITAIVNERDALRKRVTDLLEANNRLVEARRAASRETEQMQQAFERSQDDLATVTAERDARFDPIFAQLQAVEDKAADTLWTGSGLLKGLALMLRDLRK